MNLLCCQVSTFYCPLRKKRLLFFLREQMQTCKGRWILLCLFFWKSKKWSDFEKKCPDCVHPWVNFFIQNVGLRVSKRKNLKLFHAGRFFLLFLTKYLLKCPNSMKPPLHWNVSGCAPEMRTSGSTVIKLNPLSVIILVCLLHLKNKTAR